MMARVVVVDVEELKELIHGAVKSAITGHVQPLVWVDGHSAPMGARAFQRLAREGAFPAVKVGKKWQARSSDVDAYMDRYRPSPQAETPSTDDTDPVRLALDAGRLRVLKSERRPG